MEKEEIGEKIMKKRTLIILLIAVLLLVNVTFAYIATTMKTNELTIKVGQPDEGVAVLTESQPGYVLIPFGSIATQSNERQELTYQLIVNTTMNYNYYISHNLPSQFTLTTSNTQTTFQSGRAYTITIRMNEPVVVNQVFYITIDLI